MARPISVTLIRIEGLTEAHLGALYELGRGAEVLATQQVPQVAGTPVQHDAVTAVANGKAPAEDKPAGKRASEAAADAAEEKLAAAEKKKAAEAKAEKRKGEEEERRPAKSARRDDDEDEAPKKKATKIKVPPDKVEATPRTVLKWLFNEGFTTVDALYDAALSVADQVDTIHNLDHKLLKDKCHSLVEELEQ